MNATPGILLCIGESRAVFGPSELSYLWTLLGESQHAHVHQFTQNLGQFARIKARWFPSRRCHSHMELTTLWMLVSADSLTSYLLQIASRGRLGR